MGRIRTIRIRTLVKDYLVEMGIDATPDVLDDLTEDIQDMLDDFVDGESES
jgi:hypothetical protein